MEIAKAWFDQATKYWKQATTFMDGNFIEVQSWLKIIGHLNSNRNILLFLFYSIFFFIVIHYFVFGVLLFDFDFFICYN